MVTHIDLKNFPLSLIQRLRSVETSTGLRLEYLMQAALIQGLRESAAPIPATPSVSPVPAASLMPSAPAPVIVAGEDPDLNLR